MISLAEAARAAAVAGSGSHLPSDPGITVKATSVIQAVATAEGALVAVVAAVVVVPAAVVTTATTAAEAAADSTRRLSSMQEVVPVMVAALAAAVVVIGGVPNLRAAHSYLQPSTGTYI